MNASIQHLIHHVREGHLAAMNVTRHTIWGNPFHLGPEYGYTRPVVIAQFAIYFDECPALVAEACKILKDCHLECHCAPHRCHGEVLALAVNQHHSSPELAAKSRIYLDSLDPNTPDGGSSFIIEAENHAQNARLYHSNTGQFPLPRQCAQVMIHPSKGISWPDSPDPSIIYPGCWERSPTHTRSYYAGSLRS